MAFEAGSIVARFKVDKKQWDTSVNAVKRSQNDISNQAKRTGTIFTGMWKLIAGGAFAIGALNITKKLVNSLVDTAVQVEQYRLRLETLLGSQEKANEAFSFFQKTAAQLPFSLEQVVESGVKISTCTDEFEKWLIPVADVAAAMGMELPMAADQMVRAFSSGLGAADMFRERGVSQLIKEYAKLKYGIDDISKVALPRQREIMYAAFTDIEYKFAGATDKLKDSWVGMVSMLEDAWFNLKKSIMEAGIFDFMKEGLGGVLNLIKLINKSSGERTALKWMVDCVREVGNWEAALKLLGAQVKLNELETEHAKGIYEGWKFILGEVDKQLLKFGIDVYDFVPLLERKEEKVINVVNSLDRLKRKISEIEFTKAREEFWSMIRGLEMMDEMCQITAYEWEKSMAGMEEASANYMQSLTDDICNMGTTYQLTQEQMLAGQKLWHDETLKSLTEVEEGIVGCLMSYEGGLKGILTSLKRWAAGEAVKGIMSMPMPFFVKLPLAGIALAAIQSLFGEIMRLKTGAVFERPTFLGGALVGEGGETEVLSPLSTIRTAVREVIHEPGAVFNSRPTININVQRMDDRTIRTIGEKVHREIDRQITRYSRRN